MPFEVFVTAVVVAWMIGLVMGGWSVARADSERAAPDDGYEHVQPQAFTVRDGESLGFDHVRKAVVHHGKHGERTELHDDGQWYRDGKRIVAP